MTTALIIYQTEEATTLFLTNAKSHIELAKKYCNRFINEVGMSDKEDEELSELINSLQDNDCEVDCPIEDQTVDAVYWTGLCA